ncbi:molybdopterin dinucleotide binding domain-containing protein [[Eubacterium] cellulosolvens]
MKKIQVILLTGRSLSQGREKEQGKLSESYFQSVACCEINGEDIKDIGSDYGENVRIGTKYGSIVLKAVTPKQTLERGIVFIPYGLWATQVSGSETDGTGMPSYKGVSATLESAKKEKVLTVEQLVKKSFSRKTSKKR